MEVDKFIQTESIYSQSKNIVWLCSCIIVWLLGFDMCATIWMNTIYIGTSRKGNSI